MMASRAPGVIRHPILRRNAIRNLLARQARTSPAWSVRGFSSSSSSSQASVSAQETPSRQPWPWAVAPGGIPNPNKKMDRGASREQALAAIESRSPDALARVIDPIWLRDSCTCARCVTPSSGQKTFATSDIPRSISCDASYHAATDTWRFKWQNDMPLFGDEHVTEFTTPALVEAICRRRPGEVAVARPRVARQPWDASNIASRVTRIPYAAWMGDDSGSPSSEEARNRGILDLQSTGILFITDVPHDQESVARIAERIANLQTTFYGRIWDVVNKPDAENVAFTNAYLGLHQDILYLTQPPRIQLLHCLENNAAGGESLFSDGLRAAYETLLRLPDENLAEVLGKRIPYHYDKNGHTHRKQRPLIELESGAATLEDVRAAAKIKNFWWSPPFQGPLPYAEGGKSMRLWREAAALFQTVLEHPSSVMELTMQPGECVIFDNLRVLHGRRAFSKSGARHLKGAYINHDDFESALANVPADLAAEYGLEHDQVAGQGSNKERDEVVRLMGQREWEPPEALD